MKFFNIISQKKRVLSIFYHKNMRLIYTHSVERWLLMRYELFIWCITFCSYGFLIYANSLQGYIEIIYFIHKDREHINCHLLRIFFFLSFFLCVRKSFSFNLLTALKANYIIFNLFDFISFPLCVSPLFDSFFFFIFFLLHLCDFCRM